MTGSANASVFPDPVRARAIKSLPAAAGSSTCFWIANRAWMPRAWSAATVASDRPQLVATRVSSARLASTSMTDSSSDSKIEAREARRVAYGSGASSASEPALSASRGPSSPSESSESPAAKSRVGGASDEGAGPPAAATAAASSS